MAGEMEACMEGTFSTLCEHDFQELIHEENVYFKTLKMKDSIFIWIGSTTNFDLLTVAAPSRMAQIPSSTTLLGKDVNNLHTPLTQRLAKRLKKQVMLSYNASMNEETISMAERRIIEELRKFPEKF